MVTCTPALAGTVTLSGTSGLAADRTYTPNIVAGQNTVFTSCNSGPWNYALYPFTVDTTGTYTATSTTTVNINTTFFLQGTFTPSPGGPCAPAVQARFLVSVLSPGGLPSTGTFTGTGLTLQAGVQYSVLIAFNTPYVDSRPFTLTMNGPGCIAIGSNTCANRDAEVIGLLNAQVEAAKRFASAQMFNFQSRLESLHRKKAAPAETGVGTSGGTPGGPKALGVMNMDDGLADRGDRVGANPMATDSSTAVDKLKVMGSPMTAQETQASSGAALPTPALRVDGTQKNALGTGMDIWSAGTVNFGKQGNIDSSFTTTGISAGADKRVNDELVLGMGAGFGHDREEIGANGTRNSGNSYSLGLYGSYQPAEKFFIDGLVGYSRLNFDARRYETNNGGFATSSRSGSQWFASLAGGYDHELEVGHHKLLISPYTRLDLALTRLNETTEDGAAQYNLNYSAQDIPTTSLALGVRGETTLLLYGGEARPYFRLEYLHDFARAGVAQMRYADQPSGPIYQLDSTSSSSGTTRLGLGSKYVFRKSVTLDLYYQFSYNTATNARVNTLVGGFNKAF